DVVAAGHNLTEVIPYWPEGTVFVSVVDPGVGTARKACVALTENGRYVVTPDNGCLEEIRNTYGIAAVREIDQSVNRYKGNEWSLKSDIFHGRDVFAFCGARLASGKISFPEVGPEYPVGDIVKP
ncbi:MAG: SAM-dependent chlorinase/fluorinase, partial [Oscillospiraceae bacterium]|nr:SAM-dependent chlorinase/fluorinase [Oscillospiraceae bacterium]